jgi:hypothetical protein
MQEKGLKRNSIDKFYTSSPATELCYHNIKKILNIDFENDLIIEPSAGDGAFIKIIEKLSKNNLFIDIEPENDKIIKADYLNYLLEEKDFKKVHVIGNPPFGRQSSLAFKFIKKTTSIADSFSFILPKSFKKDSMKSKINLNFHLELEIDLPENSFLLNGEKYNVPCCFQIWIKKDSPRKLKEKLIAKNFKFVKKEENPHISFRRVGVNAGLIDKETKEKSSQSHYFIKFDDKDIDSVLRKLNNLKFNFNNTVGPKSISKQELIKEFNDKLL